ncbi:hypothetical protein G6F57_014164 [Rhizopus arrhizus]|nr:hypothetical protein G6F57_014164 [Rhizopus arrhizus]
MVAANAQHVPGFAFVGIGASWWQQRLQTVAGPALRAGLDAVPGLIRQFEWRQPALADLLQRITGVQASVTRDELQRDIGLHRHAGHISAVGINATGHVHRQYRPTRRVEGVDQRLGRAGRCPVQAKPEQGVHIDLGVRQLAIELDDTATSRRKFRCSLRRQHRGGRPARQRDHLNLSPRPQGMAGQHVAVAAVVAGTDQHA